MDGEWLLAVCKNVFAPNANGAWKMYFFDFGVYGQKKCK